MQFLAVKFLFSSLSPQSALTSAILATIRRTQRRFTLLPRPRLELDNVDASAIQMAPVSNPFHYSRQTNSRKLLIGSKDQERMQQQTLEKAEEKIVVNRPQLDEI